MTWYATGINSGRSFLEFIEINILGEKFRVCVVAGRIENVRQGCRSVSFILSAANMIMIEC